MITIPHDLISGVLGVISLVIWWSLYKFKSWAVFALTLLLSIFILLTIFTLFMGMPALVFGIISIVFQGSVIWYFNRPVIKALVEPKVSGTHT